MPSTVSDAVIGLTSFHPHNIPEVDTHIIPFSFISGKLVQEWLAQGHTVTKTDLLSYLLL